MKYGLAIVTRSPSAGHCFTPFEPKPNHGHMNSTDSPTGNFFMPLFHATRQNSPGNYKMNKFARTVALFSPALFLPTLFLPASAFAQQVERDNLAAPAFDTSLLGLFLEASPVVQAVMIGLLIASVWCWAIIVDKTLLFRKTKVQLDQFEQIFWSGQSLEELYRTMSERPSSGMGALFVAAMGEWKRSFERNARSPIGLQTRIDKVLDVSLSREMERLERRLLFLATLGSAAPFVGLFGTVIGIMTSFQAIAGSKSTSLAVVAPGIAEALLATALGLLAAIPAVIAYNKLSADAGKINTRLEGFADEFSAILSRQIDEKTGA